MLWYCAPWPADCRPAPHIGRATHSLSKPLPPSPLSCHKIISQSFRLQFYQTPHLQQIMELIPLQSGWDDCFKLVALVSQLGRDAEPLLMPSHCHCPMPRTLCYLHTVEILHYLHCCLVFGLQVNTTLQMDAALFKWTVQSSTVCKDFSAGHLHAVQHVDV